MIRLAENSDAVHIRKLLTETQGEISGLDWSDIYPYWLVVEKDGQIVGCINIALSRPIGRLDLLAVDPTLGSHARGRIVRSLIYQGLATLKNAGCSGSVSNIPFELQSYKKALKKHFGAVVIGQGNMVMRTL